MKPETEPMLRAHDPPVPWRSAAPAWRVALPLVIGAILAILAAYWRTAESIVAIWWRSETFAHGFLIVPISIVLIWSRRGMVAKIAPVPDPLGFVLLAGAGLAWLVAAAGQVQFIQQYALVTMIPATVVAVAGRRVAIALTFPLAFLLFGVPVGEALIPPLMEWTADSTVLLLRWSGIPVLREGLFFAIPSGNWSVVEGCSGVRYLIASITVGALFAYLSYQRAWKRALFVVFSILVPIGANALRAYMIVMIAHLSDNKLAHGVDHFIYGWVFFGIVMLLLFWVGSFWRDDPAPAGAGSESRAASGTTPASPGRIAGAAAAVIGVSIGWPLYAAYLDRSAADGDAIVIATPAPSHGWASESTPATDWRPRYEGESATLFRAYRKGDRVVVLYLGHYRHQREGERLVTSTNIMVVQKHPVWSNFGESSLVEKSGNVPLAIRQTELRSRLQRLLVWDWFRISGRDLTNPYLAKLLLARDKLLGRGDAGSAIIVAAPYDEHADAAAETLRLFVREMKPAIDTVLAGVEARAGAAATAASAGAVR
jgi:exosortase A